jgi:hypothetical protein
LTPVFARYEGVEVVSPTEFEVVLYLNQMGVFNFVDDGSIPGCAVLKLSDGRKRSMSLWVEFITASGYLSARKIRSRFQVRVRAFETDLKSLHGPSSWRSISNKFKKWSTNDRIWFSGPCTLEIVTKLNSENFN